MKLNKLAKILFWLSSVFKALGKLCIGKYIVVDVLSLPGWFIMDEVIIYESPLKDKKLIGFNWDYFSMPDEWCRQMQKLKRGALTNKK